jgi:hypothetical protein
MVAPQGPGGQTEQTRRRPPRAGVYDSSIGSCYATARPYSPGARFCDRVDEGP